MRLFGLPQDSGNFPRRKFVTWQNVAGNLEFSWKFSQPFQAASGAMLARFIASPVDSSAVQLCLLKPGEDTETQKITAVCISVQYSGWTAEQVKCT
jgi:hypothetical protein